MLQSHLILLDLATQLAPYVTLPVSQTLDVSERTTVPQQTSSHVAIQSTHTWNIGK